MGEPTSRRLNQSIPRYDAFEPSSARASATARAIRRANTKAEIALRRALWALGLRYRLHAKDIRGRPDIIFRRTRTLVFCDGDFWHGRNWKERKRKLKRGSNSAYWIAKIESNIARDARLTAELRAEGWKVLRYWETDVLRDPQGAAARVLAVMRPRRRARLD